MQFLHFTTELSRTKGLLTKLFDLDLALQSLNE